MHIEAFFHAATSTLTYVVFDEATRDAVVIDPVMDFDPVGNTTSLESVQGVVRYIEEHGLRLRFVLETHAHADHLTAAQFLRRRFDVPVAIGEHISEVQETFRGLLDLGASFAVDGSQFDRLLADGERLSAGSLEVGVIHTPGHTPACVTYRIGDAIFTGDALFVEDYGTGRCDFPRGSAPDLYDSIQKLYTLPDETRVFVGHDYQPDGRDVRFETTIGASKAHNPQLDAETTKDGFVRFRQERDATLAAPRLLFPSIQVNVDAGRLPAPHANGVRYLRIPIDLKHPTDDAGLRKGEAAQRDD